jgi:hypothetical protein
MGKSKDASKPKGKMSAYACFTQQFREECKKKNPNATVPLAEFSKQVSEKWKTISDKEKKRYEDMAAKDKERYDDQMVDYVPPAGEGGKRKRGSKAHKDPNAPKRGLSAFFCFSNEERAKVKAKNPGYSVGDVAKELGKRWEVCPNRAKYEALAAKDKERYEREMAAYRQNGGAPASKKPAAKPAAKAAPPSKKSKVTQEDDDDDEEEDEEEEEDDEEESD